MSNLKLERRFLGHTNIISEFDKAIDSNIWDKNSLLKKHKKKLQLLKDKFVSEIDIDNYMKKEKNLSNKKPKNRTGQLKIFISLYNPEDDNLEKWFLVIQGVINSVITRPVYRVEDDIKSVINSGDESAHEGYIVVYVNNSDLINAQDTNVPHDDLGNELSVLRDNCIKKDNIIAFVHNAQSYALKEKKLIPAKML